MSSAKSDNHQKEWGFAKGQPALSGRAVFSLLEGVGGLVFGNNESSFQEDDGGVARLLERIKSGGLPEDRRRAMEELQDVVAESRSAQLAFGATGLPIVLSILREERSDLDLVRGSLETLVNALGSEGNFHGSRGQVQPGALNSELLAREEGSAPLLLSLLEEEDFYVRYHTLHLLTMLSTNSSVRLQEAVLATPQGLIRLMDMLQDREVIRNEALLLLTHLTRSAEEIQKIAVFEGIFEKLFNIIIEEGGSDGGIVVQDCLDLLNNIIRRNSSNQRFLRETLGLQPVASLLKIRKSNNPNFSQQKTINLLCLLETVTLLLTRAPDKDPGKDADVLANQTILAQNNILDHLLALSVEGRVSAVAVRSGALKCIGDLVLGHPRNIKILGQKLLGEEPDVESALHSVLRVMFKTSDVGESVAAEYVIKCFCEANPEGQVKLASTITLSPESGMAGSRTLDVDKSISFGSMLLHALSPSSGKKDLEETCRGIRVLTHILKGNLDCKKRVLQIQLENVATPLVASENLMSRCMRYLAAGTSPLHDGSVAQGAEAHEEGRMWLRPVLLRFLVVWLAECPAAVASFLEPAGHLPYMVELLTSADDSLVSVHVKGLAAVLLGECIVYNTIDDGAKGASMVVDMISQRVGLSTYFSSWDALESNAAYLAAVLAAGGVDMGPPADSKEDNVGPIFLQEEDGQSETVNQLLMETFYEMELVKLIQEVHPMVKDRVVQLFSQMKTKMSLPSLTDRKEGESEADYVGRLQSIMQKQAMEMKELIARNAALVEELVSKGGINVDSMGGTADPTARISSRVELETLKQQVQAYQQSMEDMEAKLLEKERETMYYKQLAEKHEADLKSLSTAYNSLEQENYRLDAEVRNLHGGGALVGTTGTSGATAAALEAAKEEGRREAEEEHDGEMNDLLVCLGQEESKVKKLVSRLHELGEDATALLEGIGEEPEGEEGGEVEEEEGEELR